MSDEEFLNDQGAIIITTVSAIQIVLLPLIEH